MRALEPVFMAKRSEIFIGLTNIGYKNDENLFFPASPTHSTNFCGKKNQFL